MNMASTKSLRSSIVFTVGGLATFLVVASFILASYPINSSFYGYFQEGSRVKRPALVSLNENDTDVGPQGIVIREPSTESRERGDSVPEDGTKVEVVEKVEGSAFDTESSSDDKMATPKLDKGSASDTELPSDDNMVAPNFGKGSASDTGLSSDGKMEIGMNDGSVSQNKTQVKEIDKNDSEKGSSETVDPSPSELKSESRKVESQSCDLYQGKWVYDPAGPLYTNNTCPAITQMQNCQGNGRPDKDYENYRWKPDQCDIPRFNPRKFLELMKGKTLAFIGDSVARNQMESMLCILWQEETPKNRGNRRMQRWYFRSTSTMIVRIWSSWLVHQNTEPFKSSPKGVTKVFLDIPDETFMQYLPTFDVVVLSSGHWFAKQSTYVLNNDIVGGQLWWPKDAGVMKVNNVEAFGISVETYMSAITANPNFTGLAITRSYSPDHYEGGAWNTGGSCTGKVRPLDEILRNKFTDAMHEKQLTGFKRALERAGSGGGKLKFMDITEFFGYRADGHPGPYRNPDPNKKTKRGPNGEPPPQDCLHWCMPGPVDTWNEILMEVIRREFERK